MPQEQYSLLCQLYIRANLPYFIKIIYLLRIMKSIKNRDILLRIVEKGGLWGVIARMYLNDDEKADSFIIECAVQCHKKLAFVLWDQSLIDSIINYAAKYKSLK